MGGGYSQNGCNGVVNSHTNYEMVDLDGAGRTLGTRTKSDVQYLKIRNGQDEYKWWIEEAIQDSTDDETVRMKRGGVHHWEKAIRPTGKLLLALWIETLIGGDADGAQWIPLDTTGNNTKRFREKDDTL